MKINELYIAEAPSVMQRIKNALRRRLVPKKEERPESDVAAAFDRLLERSRRLPISTREKFEERIADLESRARKVAERLVELKPQIEQLYKQLDAIGSGPATELKARFEEYVDLSSFEIPSGLSDADRVKYISNNILGWERQIGIADEMVARTAKMIDAKP